jgi:hypothetical protein
LEKTTTTKRRKKMKTQIIDGNLVITIPMQTPTPSASGKTLVVATTSGNKTTEVEVQGKPVIVGLNAYIKR